LTYWVHLQNGNRANANTVDLQCFQLERKGRSLINFRGGVLLLVFVGSALSQDNAAVRPEEKRLFGLLPNYKSVAAGAKFEPLTAKQKFSIARQDSFDPMVLIVTGINAGQAHLTNQYPTLGQGFEGYMNRYVRAGADTIFSNFVTEGLFPSLLHHDPRYFRKGSAYPTHTRLWFSLTRIFRARGDDGQWHMNYSELLGNATVVGVGSFYYPEESRRIGPMAARFGFQVGTDAAFNVLKEYWPDIHDKFLKHNHSSRASSAVISSAPGR